MEEFTNKIKGLQKILLDPRLKQEMPPLFYNYFGANITREESIKNYFNHTASLLNHFNIKGKEVLDIGCGFGLRSICLLLLSAKSALGIDISKEMIDGAKTLASRLPDLNIEFKQEDFLLMSLPQGSFDIALLFEALSHIRDTSALLDRVKEALRPSGILYISDGNNDMFLTSRLKSRRDWKKSEHGPIDEEMARDGREIDRLPHFQARMEIIKRLSPSLDSKTVEIIAKKTQGMWGEEITNATREFIDTGEVKQKASFPYRNPYSGEFPELGLNPLKLRKELAHRGFECRFLPPPFVYGVEMSDRTRVQRIIARLVAPLLRIMPEVLLPFSLPALNIKATKLK